jgi:hypothetical protein
MSNFGNRQDYPTANNFGQEPPDRTPKVCCLNTTVDLRVSLIVQDFQIIAKSAYQHSYVAYLKCQKKCPEESFETQGDGPLPRNSPDGGLILQATWKFSENCSECAPKKKLNKKIKDCRKLGPDFVMVPPSLRIIQFTWDFVNTMTGGGGADEGTIKSLMEQFMTEDPSAGLGDGLCGPRKDCSSSFGKQTITQICKGQK